MRLLIITFDPPENVGGVEGRAVAYTRHLMSTGNFVELVALAPRYDFSSENFQGTKLLRYPSSLTKVPMALAKTIREIERSGIDSLFFLSGGITLFGLLLLLHARMKRLRSVVFLYGKDILSARRSLMPRLLLNLAPILARRIAVNSRFTAGLLPRLWVNRVSILYPGVEPSIAEDLPPVGDDGLRRILFVGRLVKRKGADQVMRAFRDLSAEFPDVRLEIVGDGEERQALKKLSEDFGLQERVHFFGELKGKALYQRFMLANVFVMPSKRMGGDAEGFGTVFLEAGLFGKPSVGTWSGGIPEAIEDHVTGLLVPEDDLTALQNSLKVLLSDAELSRRLGLNARDRALKYFTWESTTASLVEMLKKNNRENG